MSDKLSPLGQLLRDKVAAMPLKFPYPVGTVVCINGQLSHHGKVGNTMEFKGLLHQHVALTPDGGGVWCTALELTPLFAPTSEVHIVMRPCFDGHYRDGTPLAAYADILKAQEHLNRLNANAVEDWCYIVSLTLQ